MKLRHKPLVLEAFHWTADGAQEADPVWAIDALKNGAIVLVNTGTPLAGFGFRQTPVSCTLSEGIGSSRVWTVSSIHAMR